MNGLRSRRRFGVAAVPVLAFVAAILGWSNAAWAHHVSGIEANCNAVTVHFVQFPATGVTAHIAATIEGHGTLAADVFVQGDQTASLDISAATAMLHGAAAAVDVDVTWNYEGAQHAHDTLSVTCGSSTTTTHPTTTTTDAATTTTLTRFQRHHDHTVERVDNDRRARERMRRPPPSWRCPATKRAAGPRPRVPTAEFSARASHEATLRQAGSDPQERPGPAPAGRCRSRARKPSRCSGSVSRPSVPALRPSSGRGCVTRTRTRKTTTRSVNPDRRVGRGDLSRPTRSRRPSAKFPRPPRT